MEALRELYDAKYPYYPLLYFYGLGNGVWLANILENPRHHHIVVFENDLELLWAVLSVVDLSEALKAARIMLFYTPFLSEEDLVQLAQTQPFLAFSRTYFLELACEYYEAFGEEILKLNAVLMRGFEMGILESGNDPKDALQGIEQFVLNI
ncbi:MAG: DUF115 domain-containing protein, partial [Campylobacter sp.]|nr:DUF115 domain-containing protein [Campylobacter sp.]